MTDNDTLRSAASAAATGAQRGAVCVKKPLRVVSPNTRYTSEHVYARYEYHTAAVRVGDEEVVARPSTHTYEFRTALAVPRLGLLQVGWGGNNGSTVTAAVVANREGIEWEQRAGRASPNYFGSLTQAATVRLGFDESGRDVYVPLSCVLPMAKPSELVLGGWDISSMSLADAVDRAGVIEPDLRRQLRPRLRDMRPLRGAYDAAFIAKNQAPRADHVIPGTKQQQLEQLRADIRNFKAAHALDKAVVVWTGNSERYSALAAGVHDTADNLLAAIRDDHAEVSPSTLYAVAAILEDCPYANGSPQNTFVPGCIELARRRCVPICGDDFKSGQTKMKSVLVDYLVSCGIKVRTMVTYNHLGNNDMYQLTDGAMWKPKSASKSRVIEDIVDANGVLYEQPPPGEGAEGGDGARERPDHVVVVKYVPFLGDSKRDVSEYTSEAFMGAHYTTIMHNECLDSILCAPLIIDLAVLSELFCRVQYRVVDAGKRGFERMDPVLSVLGFFMKLPLTPAGEPIVNALHRQRACIENMLKACVGLPPESQLLLETKCPAQRATGEQAT